MDSKIRGNRLFQALGGSQKRPQRPKSSVVTPKRNSNIPLGPKLRASKPQNNTISHNRLAQALTASRPYRVNAKTHATMSKKVQAPVLAKQLKPRPKSKQKSNTTGTSKANSQVTTMTFKNTSMMLFLRIGNLPSGASGLDIEHIMGQFGPIAKCIVHRTPSKVTAELFYMDETSLAKGQQGMSNIITEGGRLSVEIHSKSSIVLDDTKWLEILDTVRAARQSYQLSKLDRPQYAFNTL